MKNTEKYISIMGFWISIILFLTSCQDNYLTDLTPDTPHSTHFAFNSPAFNKAMINIDTIVPDTVYQIDQPEDLISRSPFTYEETWWSTDTFTFDPEDFQVVLSAIISTVIDHPVVTSHPSPKLAWIEVAGRMAYSKAKTYWLIPQWHLGNRYFIQISRTGTWWSQQYTAHGVWMQAKIKDKKGDVS